MVGRFPGETGLSESSFPGKPAGPSSWPRSGVDPVLGPPIQSLPVLECGSLLPLSTRELAPGDGRRSDPGVSSLQKSGSKLPHSKGFPANRQVIGSAVPRGVDFPGKAIVDRAVIFVREPAGATFWSKAPDSWPRVFPCQGRPPRRMMAATDRRRAGGRLSSAEPGRARVRR